MIASECYYATLNSSVNHITAEYFIYDMRGQHSFVPFSETFTPCNSVYNDLRIVAIASSYMAYIALSKDI